MNGQAKQSGLYDAFVAKDARFDGRFFVGVSSTGIYCRPVCRARIPKKENCTFFEFAAEAEQAGYRPCLLCRPELAPGRSITDAKSNLARRAARLLEADCSSGEKLATLTARLGCSERHLRRVFKEEYRITPIQYLQTYRLLLAKNLLTETDLAIIDVAMSAGFGSLRRFNELFKTHYKLSPTALRKRAANKICEQKGVTLFLAYRPPYLWERLLGFFEQRAIPGVEIVANNEYCRTVRHINSRAEEVRGWIKVGHDERKNSLVLTIDEALLSALPQVLSRIRTMFDLYCEPVVVYEALRSMNEIRPGLCVLGTRLPGCYDSFEMSTRAILGQQITVKAARTLAGRIAHELGEQIETGIEGLTHLFPSAKDMLVSEAPLKNRLGELGIISSRSATIQELASCIVSQKITLDVDSDPEEEMGQLLSIKGIGAWTAQYIAMRALEWPDSFLETDVGIKHALAPASPKEMLKMAKGWQPWRSYATINLWNSLNM